MFELQQKSITNNSHQNRLRVIETFHNQISKLFLNKNFHSMFDQQIFFMSNKSSYWNKSQTSYNSNYVINALKSFRREDLADPASARRWIQFAKEFSQMTLTTNDIEQLGFQSFYALKLIMAASLSSLSEETMTQSQEIAALEKEERTLKRDLQNLNKIEEENHRKEQKLKEEYDKLEHKQSDMSYRVNEQDDSILGGASDI